MLGSSNPNILRSAKRVSKGSRSKFLPPHKFHWKMAPCPLATFSVSVFANALLEFVSAAHVV